MVNIQIHKNVSTHSRPKAAGTFDTLCFSPFDCFNTQPPEGGWGRVDDKVKQFYNVSTHSRPKAAGPYTAYIPLYETLFQHTAARRRLVTRTALGCRITYVSTHSRPKAAGCLIL